MYHTHRGAQVLIEDTCKKIKRVNKRKTENKVILFFKRPIGR